MKIRGTYLDANLSSGKRLYSFWTSDHHIPEDHEYKFIGEQTDGKSNTDVHEVMFNTCIMTKVPQGLTKTFPNLKMLIIYNSKLKKICKNDLVEYKNLENFTCSGNEIEYLPGDLFEDFNNLRIIDFSKNKLTVIHPNLLNGTILLYTVNFRGNPNFDKCFSIYPVTDKNASLEEIRLDLHKKYCSRPNQQFEANNQNKNQARLSLTDDIKNFLADETTKDFKININDREFPVHKFLLSARSPTLAELLKNNPEVENLNLVDISVETFEIIHKFLYTDGLPGDYGTNFLHLFAAAGKLKIQELKNYAANKLIDQINQDNVIDILNVSKNYEHEELRTKAFKVVKKKYPKVEFKDEWAADPEKLIKIIEIIKQREEADRKLEEEFKKLGT
ncbi:unnamed protein product [Chironomus riparius]|uniref:BTB domain-containing protein n=1 Tax=Chironomus riparius TaxID=315576 RepID=A0A9P0JB28_9DIPT|nr:unnamed protein product [Chironomus riparius]